MVTPPSFDPWSAALGGKQDADRSHGSAKQAAQQFEALLIRQFLSNSRSTSWLSDQQESETGWREIADDSLAGYLVKAGGIGLSKQVESLINQVRSSSTALKGGREADSKAQAADVLSLNGQSVPTVTLNIRAATSLVPRITR